jgi:hypothetical protein
MNDEKIADASDEEVSCDICGKLVSTDELWWLEGSDKQCCAECRAEEESCGCSD